MKQRSEEEEGEKQRRRRQDSSAKSSLKSLLCFKKKKKKSMVNSDKWYKSGIKMHVTVSALKTFTQYTYANKRQKQFQEEVLGDTDSISFSTCNSHKYIYILQLIEGSSLHNAD